MPKRFWIGNHLDPDKRPQIVVSSEDAKKIADLPRDSDDPVAVFDTLTGAVVRVRWADCGLSCRCALELDNSRG